MLMNAKIKIRFDFDVCVSVDTLQADEAFYQQCILYHNCEPILELHIHVPEMLICVDYGEEQDNLLNSPVAQTGQTEKWTVSAQSAFLSTVNRTK